MTRLTLTAAAALALFALDASAKDCSGVFIRRSCMAGAAEGFCGYPKEKGAREDFMGWELEGSERAYAVYRLGAYPAKDVRLDRGCRLSRY